MPAASPALPALRAIALLPRPLAAAAHARTEPAVHAWLSFWTLSTQTQPCRTRRQGRRRCLDPLTPIPTPPPTLATRTRQTAGTTHRASARRRT